METTIHGNVKVNKINKHIFVWIGSFLVGYLGVDRFMRGQIGLGIFKLLIGSWITMGIWPLVDFIIAVVKAYSTYSDTEELTFLNGKYSK
ncbi:TM2 domain-containing protein [Fructobacillus sp. M158]|uniref:TM2 domain-containing protein n=1 Tax=Fructobacillus parabroussonetiae TaxID=2713174 RepID=UPI00200B8A55|nr:TM2 domain-containing protein [Fructobacillus parabroussonetiae]MCK8617332.1 TM2 domain-containing protein [Fructobacillus parabroussonetiae]